MELKGWETGDNRCVQAKASPVLPLHDCPAHSQCLHAWRRWILWLCAALIGYIWHVESLQNHVYSGGATLCMKPSIGHLVLDLVMCSTGTHPTECMHEWENQATVNSTFPVSAIFHWYLSEIRTYNLHSNIDLNQLKSPFIFHEVCCQHVCICGDDRSCFFSMGIATVNWSKYGSVPNCGNDLCSISDDTWHNYHNQLSVMSTVGHVQCQHDNTLDDWHRRQ